MDALRVKSMALSDLFISLITQHCDGHGLELISPQDANLRGSQVSYSYENGFGAMQALIARGVIGDFRQPNVMRFGFAPLYVTHIDLWDAVQALRAVLVGAEWKKFPMRAGVVT